ncbi:MAG: hypothetical protein IT580_13450 [Verrucomicrobiales bacterium]|nr:hypothetical protein [Verrucomicrobiales bacterium]
MVSYDVQAGSPRRKPPGVGTCANWRLVTILILLGLRPLGVLGQVVRTDGSTALHTAEIPLHLPFGVGLDRVEFELGIATREAADAPGFLDAASLSLQPIGGLRAALLVAADAGGVFWLPPNPGGLDGNEALLRHEDRVWPVSEWGSWSWSASFAVSLTVPLTWQDCGSVLYLDLFDNLNDTTSMAYVRSVRVTPRTKYFLLESSSSPVGPYAVEMGVDTDASAQELKLPAGGTARFFRLRADSEVTLRMVNPSSTDWRFTYAFPAPQPVLEIATRAEGPYVTVTNAVLNLEAREFRVPRMPASAGPRFYRARANVRVALTSFTREGVDWRVRFEYRPRVFSLESSAQPCGPFAEESKAVFDTARQTIQVSRTELVRFFRLAQSSERAPVSLGTVRRADGTWRIPFLVPSSNDPP